MDYLLACELAGAVAIGAASQVRQLAGHRPCCCILFGTLSAMVTNCARQEAQPPLFVRLLCRALSLYKCVTLRAFNGFPLFVCLVSCLARFQHTIAAKADTSPAWNLETIMNVYAYPKVTADKLIKLGVDRVFAHAAAKAAAPRAAAVGRAALAAAAARHVDGKAAAHAAALLIVARENQRAAQAATEAAAAWVRAAYEAGFTLIEKKQIINTQAD